MKQAVQSFLLALFMSMVGIQAFAHDIEVNNADGKTIYYVFNKVLPLFQLVG